MRGMDRRNHYLRDKADRKYREDMRRGDRRRDMRSDYRSRDYREDMNDYYNDSGYDYNDQRDMRDYADYVDNEEEMYEKKKERLKKKLESKDRYRMTKEQVTNHARQIGVKFDDYDEDEFYLTYLMMSCDYHSLFSDPTMFIKMAKAFLEDDDIHISPSEKLCIYVSEIAMAE